MGTPYRCFSALQGRDRDRNGISLLFQYTLDTHRLAYAPKQRIFSARRKVHSRLVCGASLVVDTRPRVSCTSSMGTNPQGERDRCKNELNAMMHRYPSLQFGQGVYQHGRLAAADVPDKGKYARKSVEKSFLAVVVGTSRYAGQQV
jgi:hypothetical protein